MLEIPKRKLEIRNKLPFMLRCHLARNGVMTINEFQNISGMKGAKFRPTIRRAFNDLVKNGFARKEKSGKESHYFSVREKESDSVRKFAEFKDVFYYPMDMDKLSGGYCYCK